MTTWQERQGYGRKLLDLEIAGIIDRSGYRDWNAIRCLATILAETDGYEWSRPMVVKDDPDAKAHLSVDRGICAFNSYWFSRLSDRIVYDPELAIPAMIEVGEDRADPEWKLNFDLWNVNRGDPPPSKKFLPQSREVVNAVRATYGEDPI